MRPYDVVYDNYDNLLSCMCQADEKNLFHETILNVRNCCGIVICFNTQTNPAVMFKYVRDVNMNIWYHMPVIITKYQYERWKKPQRTETKMVVQMWRAWVIKLSNNNFSYSKHFYYPFWLKHNVGTIVNSTGVRTKEKRLGFNEYLFALLFIREQ